MQTILRLAKLVLNYKYQLVAGIFCMLAFALFNVAPVWVLKGIVDGLQTDEVFPLSRFVYVGLAIVGLFSLKGLSFYGQNFLMGALGQKLIRDLREQLFKKIISMPLSFFNKSSTGNLISRITVDLQTLNEAVTVGIVGPLRDIPQIVFLLVTMAIFSWQLSLVSIFLLPPAGWLIVKFGEQSKKVTTKRLNKYGELTGLLTESITGIRVVKAFGMEEYEIERFNKENQGLFKHFLKAIGINSYSNPIIEFVGGVCAAVILSWGGYLIIHDQITGGEFAGFIVAFWALTDPIKKLNGFTIKLQEGSSAAVRIFEILDRGVEIQEVPDAKILPPIKNQIQININRFGYEKDEPVLRDIHLDLKAGTITALVGSSGSGKTTLSNLIPRFYDLCTEDGSIKIDGFDLREITLHSLRTQIAIVTQEVILFNDTVANNISYGDPNCSLEKIKAAAKNGFAHNFIMALPDGYDQIIGEKGARLSGGQRQRIAISRALIKNAPILILDEATSALDTESEKEVEVAIKNLMQNRTTLVIAHRLSTIQNADIIHVLKDGKIIESGGHKELLEQSGEYHKLYDMQFQDTGEYVQQNSESPHHS
jgi:ATP-binding cassette, subfamily B, bacterial MsbA